MKGLYCTANASTNQHIKYLISRYQDISDVVDNEETALAYLAASDYDLLLLEYKDKGPFSPDQLISIATCAQQLRPCCAVILYRDYPPISTAVHSNIPKALYDFCISRSYEITALARTIAILMHRRLYFFHQRQIVHNIRGIIYGPYFGINHLYHAHLNRMGFEMTLTEDIDILEKNIDVLQPDFFITHCHTVQGDFDRVKKLCQRIRVGMPTCTLFVTCNWVVIEDYKEKHQLKEYGYDHLINSAIALPELVWLILAGEAKKYVSFLPDAI